MVKDILNSGNNYGFQWMLQTEVKYRSTYTASSDYSGDPTKRPKLTVTYSVMEKHFYLKDHLGNIRVTVDDEGDVASCDDYYPFGLQMDGRSFNDGNTNSLYKFSGKELDEENGLDLYWFDPGRAYDPMIGRWLCVDPLAGKYPSWSSYNYVLNNPMILVDPDGKQVRAESYVYRQYWNNSAKPMHPEFRAWVNKAGPAFLNAASIPALGISGTFSMGLSLLSTGWTLNVGDEYDKSVSIITFTMSALSKTKIGAAAWNSTQLLYDIIAGGNDTSNESKNQNDGTTKADNTRVANSLLQSVARDKFGIGPSPKEMWDKMKKEQEERKKKEKQNEKNEEDK